MLLWEIKAQSLKLMFTDYDMNFDQEEFQSRLVYDNSNTREKLVRMNDAIARGIDVYYDLVGVNIRTITLPLKEEDGVFKNEVDVSSVVNFGQPTRVDFVVSDMNNRSVFEGNQFDFFYNITTNTIQFYNVDYTRYEGTISFRVWYRCKKVNIPTLALDMSYDLNVLNIDEDIQRLLPFYVKGELYEEDDEVASRQARSHFIETIRGKGRKQPHTQTRVKRESVYNMR